MATGRRLMNAFYGYFVEGNATPGEKIPCESSNTLDDSGLSM